MQKWEYYYGYGLTIEEINRLGEEGWELIAVGGDAAAHFYFKRPKK